MLKAFSITFLFFLAISNFSCSKSPTEHQESRPEMHDFTIGPDDQIYIATISGIYKSQNNGGSWKRVTDIGRRFIAVNPKNYLYTTNILRSVHNSSDPNDWRYALYRSTDNGVTWELTGLRNIYYGRTKMSTNFEGDIFIFFLSSLGGGRYLYRSTNDGMNWSKCELPYSSQFNYNGFKEIAFNSSNDIIVGSVGSVDAIYRSIDKGENWEIILPNQSVDFDYINWHSLLVNSNDDIFVGIEVFNYWSDTPSREFLFHSIDNGNTWSIISEKDKPFVMLIANSMDEIFAFTSDNIIYKSSDDGKSWHKTGGDIFKDYYLSKCLINSLDHLFVQRSDQSGKSLYRSTDGGVSWIKIWP